MRPALKSRNHTESPLHKKFQSRLQLPKVGRSKFVEKPPRQVSFSFSLNIDERDDIVEAENDMYDMDNVANTSLEKQFSNIVHWDDDDYHRRPLSFEHDDVDSVSDGEQMDLSGYSSDILNRPKHWGDQNPVLEQFFGYDDSYNSYERHRSRFNDDGCFSVEDPRLCSPIFSPDYYFSPSPSAEKAQHPRSSQFFDRLQIAGQRLSSPEVVEALVFPSKPQLLLDRTPSAESVLGNDDEVATINATIISNESASTNDGRQAKVLFESQSPKVIPEPTDDTSYSEDLVHGRSRDIFRDMLEEHIRLKKASVAHVWLSQQRAYNSSARVIFDDIMQVNMTKQTRITRLQRALRSRKAPAPITIDTPVQEEENIENKQPGIMVVSDNRRFQVTNQTRRGRLTKATRRIKVHDRESFRSGSDNDSQAGGFWSLDLQNENSRVTKLLKRRKYGAAPPKYDLSQLAASFVLYTIRLQAFALGYNKPVDYKWGEATLYCYPYERSAIFALNTITYFFHLRWVQSQSHRSLYTRTSLLRGVDHRTTISSEYTFNSPRVHEMKPPKNVHHPTEPKEDDSAKIAEELEFFYDDDAGNLVHPSFKLFVVTALIETDLSREAYIDAHNNNSMVEIVDEDDGLALELMTLPWFEADLRREMRKIDMQESEPVDDDNEEVSDIDCESKVLIDLPIPSDEPTIEAAEIEDTTMAHEKVEDGKSVDSSLEEKELREEAPVENEEPIITQPPFVQNIDMKKKNLAAIEALYEAVQSPSAGDDKESRECGYFSDDSESSFDDNEARRIVDAAIKSLLPANKSFAQNLPVIQPLMDRATSPESEGNTSNSDVPDEKFGGTLSPSISELSAGAGSASVQDVEISEDDEAVVKTYDEIPSLLNTESSVSTSEFVTEAENMHVGLQACSYQDGAKSATMMKSIDSKSETRGILKTTESKTDDKIVLVEKQTSENSGFFRQLRPNSIVTNFFSGNENGHDNFNPQHGMCIPDAGIEVLKQFVCSPPTNKESERRVFFRETPTYYSDLDRSSFEIEVVNKSSSESDRSIYIIRSTGSVESSIAHEKASNVEQSEIVEPSEIQHAGNQVTSPTWSLAPVLSSFSNISDISDETGVWSLEPHVSTAAERKQDNFRERLRESATKASQESSRETLASSSNSSNEDKDRDVTQLSNNPTPCPPLTEKEPSPIKITCSDHSDVSKLTIEVSIESHFKDSTSDDSGLHSISIDESDNVELELNEALLSSQSSEAKEDNDQNDETDDELQGENLEQTDLAVPSSSSAMELPMKEETVASEESSTRIRVADIADELRRTKNSSPMTMAVKDFALEILYSSNRDIRPVSSPIADTDRLAHYQTMTRSSREKEFQLKYPIEEHVSIPEVLSADQDADMFSGKRIFKLLSDGSSDVQDNDIERPWVSSVISSVSEDDEDGGHARKMRTFKSRLENWQQESDWDTAEEKSSDWDTQFDPATKKTTGKAPDAASPLRTPKEQAKSNKISAPIEPSSTTSKQRSDIWVLGSIGEMIWSPFEAKGPSRKADRITEEKLRHIRHF